MSGIGIIVLAAGRSTRFGQGQGSKLLTALNGVPIVSHAVAAAIEAEVGKVVVVTGHQARDVATAVAAMPARVVHAPRFADGMAASLVAGVRALESMDAVMVALGDQPELRSEAYRRVSERWRRSGAAIVVPRYVETTMPAHPTLFAASVFGELAALQGDVGARAIIVRDPSRVVEEPLEWNAPEDVDTIEDFDRARRRLESAAPRDHAR